MQKNLIKYLTLASFSFFIGFYLCILIKKVSLLSISNQVSIEINPLELITTAITIFLAVYVTRTLGKKNDLEKTEKELFIDYLIKFKDLTSNKIYSILKEETFDTPSTKSDLKILRKKANTIINLGVEAQYFDENEKLANDLNDKVRDIWELLTDCPEKITGRASANVKQGVERLRLEQINKVEMNLIDIEQIIFNLSLKVNQK